ncbi:MAG: hypothetical protein ACODAU_06695 [Myxococcota bacterium]
MSRVRIAAAVLCVLIAGGVVAAFVATGLEATGGEPAAPLDDPYIHFQYARTIVEGRPFRYHPGQAPSSGASSLLYLALLVVPYALGLQGISILWGAWVIGAASLAATLWLAGEAAVRLAAPSARLPAIAAVAAWAWLGWHAASAMEVALLAALVMAAWVAALVWGERPPEGRGARLGLGIGALAFALPLARPEAAPFALALGLLLAAAPARGRARWRWLGLFGLAPLAFHAGFWWLATGSPSTNGARAKWLLHHPYLGEGVFLRALGRNLDRLRMFWLDQGDAWTAGFFPPFVVAIAVGAGLVWLFLPRRRLPRRVLAIPVAATLACFAGLITFATFSDHRFRYTVPFVAPLLVVGILPLFDLGRAIGRRVGRRGVAPALSFTLGASLLGTWSGALDHYARATGEIAGQHYRMIEHFARLPEEARVGITDAGILAYLGPRPTLDLVGLTTNATTPYFAAGGCAHYEMLEALPPEQRPTHLALYPYWWRAPGVLGRLVADVRTPAPNTIVGGPVMGLYEARLDGVGLGEQPVLIDPPGRLVDAVDVGDVPDERAHGYRAAGSGYGECVYRAHHVPGLGRLQEGGRIVRSSERMVLRGVPGQPLVLVLRTDGPGGGELAFEVSGTTLGTLRIPEGRPRLRELTFRVPGARVRERNELIVGRLGGGAVTSLHWWAYRGE